MSKCKSNAALSDVSGAQKKPMAVTEAFAEEQLPVLWRPSQP
jgi:hypothetical protein